MPYVGSFFDGDRHIEKRTAATAPTCTSPTTGLGSPHENYRDQPTQDVWQRHPDSEQSLLAWIDEAKNADWSTPTDIKEQFRNASILKSRRAVFNIKGNDYRFVVAVAYRYGALYIKFVGTHKQYDAIDADTVETE
jgi:mRNA interferase HigB